MFPSCQKSQSPYKSIYITLGKLWGFAYKNLYLFQLHVSVFNKHNLLLLSFFFIHGFGVRILRYPTHVTRGPRGGPSPRTAGKEQDTVWGVREPGPTAVSWVTHCILGRNSLCSSWYVFLHLWNEKLGEAYLWQNIALKWCIRIVCTLTRETNQWTNQVRPC